MESAEYTFMSLTKWTTSAVAQWLMLQLIGGGPLYARAEKKGKLVENEDTQR